MPSETLSKIYTDLYTSFLRSLSLSCDDGLADLSMDVTLGAVLHGSCRDRSNFGSETEIDQTSEHEVYQNVLSGDEHFQDEELLTYGTPVRRHLSSSTTRHLREEIENTLRDIAKFFYAGQGDEDLDENLFREFNRLPGHIQARKDELNSKQLEIASLSLHVAELLNRVKSTRGDLDAEIKHLITTTLPALDAARTASIEHLAATLEATFQMLNAVRERTRSSFYNHKHETGPDVSQALAIAHGALKEEEKDLKLETRKLDQQIQDYETLLKLVDGDSGGYRQIVRDWLEVKQGTDECLKDLRRLGWTGD